jgi:hypothetical protein
VTSAATLLQVSEERLAAYTGTPPEGTLTVGDGKDRIAVWRFPHDPYLPGLATAFDPAAVARLLRGYRLGDQQVRLTVRAYRPRRRAVIEASSQRRSPRRWTPPAPASGASSPPGLPVESWTQRHACSLGWRR